MLLAIKGRKAYDPPVSVPSIFLFSYLVLGMITTASVWSDMAMEIEMSLHLEEDEEMHGVLRGFLMVMFVLTWPLVLYEVVSKQ